MESPTPQDYDEINSLESPDIDSAGSSEQLQPATTGATQPNPNDPKKPDKDTVPLKQRVKRFVKRVNIYLLLFILLLLIAVMGVVVAIQNGRKADQASELMSQELTPEALEELRNNDVSIGDPKQTLSVESNADFAGKVLVRGSLDVAGQINVGGSLSLPGITVSGASNFDEVQINNLTISGDTSVLGQLSVQNNFSVTGNATFGGTLSVGELAVDNLRINGDLQIIRHIDAGGAAPRISNGGATGSGGTTSVNGTDTAGTITINTGSNPSAGTLATVTFANAFTQTPHVVITPSSSGGAGLSYYVTRTSTGFTVATTSAPAPGISFTFDFIAID